MNTITKRSHYFCFAILIGFIQSCYATAKVDAPDEQQTKQTTPLIEINKGEKHNKIEKIGGYFITHDPGLPLCKKFLAYLNRKPVNYYNLGLERDSNFQFFNLPSLQKMDNKRTLPVIKARYFDKQRYEKKWWNEAKRVGEYGKRVDAWPKVKNDFLINENIETYTADIDVNHDGKKEGLLIEFIKWTAFRRGQKINNGTARYTATGENGEYIHIPIFKLSGYPFFYKKRFYSADTGNKIFSISEPSLPWDKNEGVMEGQPICEFRVK